MAGKAGSYTFYPKFQEFVTLYRGVVRVWIGDGVSTGTAGYLYAEYIDGLVQQLGFVSDYEEAKKYFADLGIELTYEEWIGLLAKMPENAKRSEAWAVGTHAGEPVSSSDETYNNNSKYYAGQASASAMAAAESERHAAQSYTDAATKADAASDSADKAREWAVSPDPVETVSGVTYESSKTYAMRCGQEIDSRIETMRTATDSANRAADAANTAATSANNAASSANTVATKLENLSSTTVTLPPSSSATTNVRTENNHFVIDFGIPKGDRGEKGERGLPDYLATSIIDGTTENGILFDWGADVEALTAKSIYFDTSVSNPQTIYEVVQPVTDAQIDNLFT